MTGERLNPGDEISAETLRSRLIELGWPDDDTLDWAIGRIRPENRANFFEDVPFPENVFPLFNDKKRTYDY